MRAYFLEPDLRLFLFASQLQVTQKALRYGHVENATRHIVRFRWDISAKPQPKLCRGSSHCRFRVDWR